MDFFFALAFCVFTFLVAHNTAVTASDSDCINLEALTATNVTCNMQNNTCGTMHFPGWECFASCPSGLWTFRYISSNATITLESSLLCPTGLDVYTLTFAFQLPQDVLPEEIQFSVSKKVETKLLPLWPSKTNATSLTNVSASEWVANVSVFCPHCEFQVIFSTTQAEDIGLQYIMLHYKDALPPDATKTDNLFAMLLATIVVLCVVALVTLALTIYCWRKKSRARREAIERLEVTQTPEQREVDSGNESGSSALTVGSSTGGNTIAFSTFGRGGEEAGGAQTKGDNNTASLQRDGFSPLPAGKINTASKETSPPGEARYSSPDEANDEHRYYGLDHSQRTKYDDLGYLQPIADPKTEAEAATLGTRDSQLYDEPDADPSPPLPFRPADLGKK